MADLNTENAFEIWIEKILHCVLKIGAPQAQRAIKGLKFNTFNLQSKSLNPYNITAKFATQVSNSRCETRH